MPALRAFQTRVLAGTRIWIWHVHPLMCPFSYLPSINVRTSFQPVSRAPRSWSVTLSSTSNLTPAIFVPSRHQVEDNHTPLFLSLLHLDQAVLIPGDSRPSFDTILLLRRYPPIHFLISRYIFQFLGRDRFNHFLFDLCEHQELRIRYLS